MKKIILALIAASFSVSAVAADAYYVGGSVGYAEQKLTIEGITVSDNGTGFSINGGYRFTPNFSAEVGYTSFGNASIGIAGDSISSKPKALYVAGVGSLPVTQEIAVFGKLGLARNKTKVAATSGGVTEFDNLYHTSPVVGLGATYRLNEQLSVVGQYETFGKVVKEDEAHLKASQFSVGLRYNF